MEASFMTPIQLRQKLLHQLNQLPEDDLPLVDEFLAFLEFKAHQQTASLSKSNSTLQTRSTGQALLEHLKTIGTWEGDDFEECLQAVYDTRLPTKFESNSNPFD
jgi:hypothetical protein